jgi:lipopolysaccharide/colanic/teichoic acid biosynthesis glycosyltransferase
MARNEESKIAAFEDRPVLAAGGSGSEGNILRLPYFAQPRPEASVATLAEYLAATRRSPAALLWKQAVDVTAALIALTCFTALLPLIALAIRLDSRGPIFYSQTRIGINRRRRRVAGYGDVDQRKVVQPGRPFRIHKLRTMRIDAEQNGPQWAARNDDRITRVGRFLRQTRLDEVPQFLNVLRGEMSLIGPRPERLCFIHKLEKEVPNYRDRLLVLPGITGLAQVINGYDDSTESVRRKVELDRQYIRSLSLWTDVRIIAHTVRVVLTGEGAA